MTKSHSKATMDIAEHLIKIKSIVKELEKLTAYAAPLRKDLYFDPAVRLHAATSELVIVADKIGNAATKDAASLVKAWFADIRWEKHL